jgi:restriction endonuclease S subunit
VHPDDFLSLEIPDLHRSEQKQIAERLDRQQCIILQCDMLLEGVDKLDWLDDSLFQFPESDLLATSFKPLVENATDYVDPTTEPDTEWRVYGISNREGVFFKETKPGREFKSGRKYKRIVKDAIAYGVRRVNVGTVGLIKEDDPIGIISPYRVLFTCKPDLYPRFTFYLMKSPYFLRKVQEAQVGAVRDELFFDLFTNIEVPIPKLEMQQQVVKAIEDQLADYEGMRRLKEQAEATMRRIVLGLFGFSDEPFWEQEL